MYDTRIAIPFAQRDKMLQALHDTHQSIVKAREHTRTLLWWPKLCDDIERIASSRVPCAHWRTLPAEPLLPSPMPNLSWQKVANMMLNITSLSWITFHAT